jgi:hypothetical protein
MATHLRDEAKTLEQWRDAGNLLQAYSPGGLGAVLILELPSLQEAQSHVSQLPLCVAGLIETELIGLYPFDTDREAKADRAVRPHRTASLRRP